jgi:hypothetical protein
MVLLARSKREAEAAMARLKEQLDGLVVQMNADKSLLTTARDGFEFLGFSFRQRNRRLYVWPRAKAVKTIAMKTRDAVRSIPSTANLADVVKRLNRILIGWCTYFRVGHSSRVFHKVDWQVRSEVQLWLRRKYRITWPAAKTALVLRGAASPLQALPHGGQGEPSGGARMNAAGRRRSESRVRENCTHGSMRGSRKRTSRRGTAPVSYSTRSPLVA